MWLSSQLRTRVIEQFDPKGPFCGEFRLSFVDGFARFFFFHRWVFVGLESFFGSVGFAVEFVGWIAWGVEKR